MLSNNLSGPSASEEVLGTVTTKCWGSSGEKPSAENEQAVSSFQWWRNPTECSEVSIIDENCTWENRAVCFWLQNLFQLFSGRMPDLGFHQKDFQFCGAWHILPFHIPLPSTALSPGVFLGLMLHKDGQFLLCKCIFIIFFFLNVQLDSSFQTRHWVSGFQVQTFLFWAEVPGNSFLLLGLWCIRKKFYFLIWKWMFYPWL